jgi:8-oxo-dGTP diphosphatase
MGKVPLLGTWMKYRNPTPTVDIIIQRDGKIVLIKRRNPPNGWALPGGFVDEGERVETAAIREAREETNMDVELTALLYVYSDPMRDPRQHTMSVVFTASWIGGELIAMDDAADAKWFDPEELPKSMAFDHRQIIDDFVRFISTGQRPQPRK